MKIKICGLKCEKDIITANSCLPDYIGFVFYKKSKRYVSPERAAELKKMLNSGILSVGVFVNDDIKLISEMCGNGTIDLVQLHGNENAEYIKNLSSVIDKPVIKAVRVKNSVEILAADRLPCDYLLLDAYCEREIGGCGEVFDYSFIPQLNKPFFLAGGINCGNIANAAECKPFAVDASSGCETDGLNYKDEKKFRELVELAHSL